MDIQSNTEIRNKELKKLKTFLFDLDGTLINSADDIAEAVNYTLKQLNRELLPKEEIVKYVGYGAKKLMEDVLKLTGNNINDEIIEKATKMFRDYYLSNPCIYTTPYPYTEELLKFLKGNNKKVGVITNKYEEVSKKILDKLTLSKYIDIVVGGDTVGEKKPSAKPVNYALNKLNTKPEESIFIGDSEVDIQAGKNANTKTGLVLYGYGKIELAKQLNPDYIFNSFKEILKKLEV